MSAPVITRDLWHARAPKTTPVPAPIGTRTATCTHHDGATPVIVTNMAQAIAQIQRDQNLHMDTNGWNDIGYNFLVISAPGYAIDGAKFEGRGRDVVGAHCLNWNVPWIGIQVAIGGDQKPSDKALASVREIHDDATYSAGHALAKKGHYQGFATACPGTFLKAWLSAGMPVSVLPTAVVVKVVNVVKTILGVPKVIHAHISGTLLVDGDLGPDTWKELQLWAGGAGWIGVQRRLGVPVDGVPGPVTWKAIQKMVGAYPDGIPGLLTIKALQRFLNSY